MRTGEKATGDLPTGSHEDGSGPAPEAKGLEDADDGSTAARAGLTALSKSLSPTVAAANVTINNLLPERIDTDRQRGMAELRSKLGGVSMEQAYEEMKATIAAGRLGRPEEFGDACAFLCSAQAGYISGQNLQLDGGSYSGLI